MRWWRESSAEDGELSPWECRATPCDGEVPCRRDLAAGIPLKVGVRMSSTATRHAAADSCLDVVDGAAGATLWSHCQTPFGVYKAAFVCFCVGVATVAPSDVHLLLTTVRYILRYFTADSLHTDKQEVLSRSSFGGTPRYVSGRLGSDKEQAMTLPPSIHHLAPHSFSSRFLF